MPASRIWRIMASGTGSDFSRRIALVVRMISKTSLASLIASAPFHAVELRPAVAHVLEVGAVGGRLVVHAERDVGRIGPEMRLHIGAHLLLRGEVGRVEPGGAQALLRRVFRPAEPGARPAGADGEIRRRRDVADAAE